MYEDKNIEHLVVTTRETASTDYSSVDVFNKIWFKPTLHVRIPDNIYENYILDYIFEKDTNSILGISKIIDTSKLTNETPDAIIDYIYDNCINLDIIDKIDKLSLAFDIEDEEPSDDVEDLLDEIQFKDESGFEYNIPILGDEILDIEDVKLSDDTFYLDSLEVYDPNVDIPLFKSELDRPWIDIDTDLLDKSVGLHTYIIRFESKLTGDLTFQQFSYIIQNDNPEKPYIYMNRDK